MTRASDTVAATEAAIEQPERSIDERVDAALPSPRRVQISKEDLQEALDGAGVLDFDLDAIWDNLLTQAPTLDTLIARFWEKVEIHPDACWIWKGAKSYLGYGLVMATQRNRKRRAIPAHRVAYELRRGSIPPGLVIDHLCRNPPCVNPDHLEPVTQRENVVRAIPFRVRKTHCPAGHPMEGSNLKLVRETKRTTSGEVRTYFTRYCLRCRRRQGRLSAGRRRERQRNAMLAV